jgi:hypothetical protein
MYFMEVRSQIVRRPAVEVEFLKYYWTPWHMFHNPVREPKSLPS